MLESRREFLKKGVLVWGTIAFGSKVMANEPNNKTVKITKESSCSLYRSVNGTPEDNIVKAIDMMGGIERIIGRNDVVVIKPNVQWWNHGAPNLSALKAFVDLIMNHSSGFDGEVVIAENCHRGSEPWKSKHSGWSPVFERNSGLERINNFNELTNHLKKIYGNRFSVCHWINVSAGGKRVFSPTDGTGYVYCDGTGGVPLLSFDNGAKGGNFRAVIMTYPIFSTEKGTIIDFKNGIWKKGMYTGQPLRFILFSALNHHSRFCGATSAIKNYLGISDLSGGPDPHNGGKLTEKYYNFHSFPFNKWDPGPETGMIGAEVGAFMNTIRRADLNITTADWIGLASRTEPPVAYTKVVLASIDPIALDYHATKYILYPNSKIPLHNPDNGNSPLNHYLVKCSESGGGVFNDGKVKVISYDFKKGTLQNDGELSILGEKQWGTNVKGIMKYLYLRYLS